MPDAGQAFPWGLTPGGTPEQATPVRPVVPVSPVDQGHFVAVPDPHALAEQPSDPSPQEQPSDPPPQPPQSSNEWSLPGQATPSTAHATPAGMDVAAAPFSPEQPAVLPPEQPAVLPTEQPSALVPGQPAVLPPEQSAEFVPGQPAALPPEQPAGLVSEHPHAAGPVPPEQPGAPAPDYSNALDNLFGEERFVEYQQGRDLSESPVIASAEVPTDLVAQPSAPRAPLPKLQRTLVWVAGALVGVLALGGLFLLGKTIAPSFAAAPVIEPEPSTTQSATPSTAPEAVPEILGPLVPGTYDWDDLLGTECVDPWGSAWDQNFTVVDCGEPHAAQLVYRATFEDSAIAAYPGLDVLQSRMNLLCASSKNIDYSAAKKYDDIQLSASFAGSESDWVEGQHDYFCFVSRSSGEQLTTDVAKPDRPAPVAVEPEP